MANSSCFSMFPPKIVLISRFSAVLFRACKKAPLPYFTIELLTLEADA